MWLRMLTPSDRGPYTIPAGALIEMCEYVSPELLEDLESLGTVERCPDPPEGEAEFWRRFRRLPGDPE